MSDFELLSIIVFLFVCVWTFCFYLFKFFFRSIRETKDYLKKEYSKAVQNNTSDSSEHSEKSEENKKVQKNKKNPLQIFTKVCIFIICLRIIHLIFF